VATTPCPTPTTIVSHERRSIEWDSTPTGGRRLDQLNLHDFWSLAVAVTDIGGVGDAEWIDEGSVESSAPTTPPASREERAAVRLRSEKPHHPPSPAPMHRAFHDSSTNATSPCVARQWDGTTLRWVPPV
jgi:hypothetical protein